MMPTDRAGIKGMRACEAQHHIHVFEPTRPPALPAGLCVAPPYFNTLAPMSPLSHLPAVPGRPAAYFWSGDAIRSRSVSDVVLHGTVDIPLPPARLTADW